MKQFFVGTICIASCWISVPSYGADTNSPAPAEDWWSGFYAGVQAGYGWGTANIDFDYAGLGTVFDTSNDPAGFLGGAFVGYRHQAANGLVFGLEADANISGQTESGSVYFTGGMPYSPITGYAEIDWTASMRARVGYAADRFLPYITGGLAVAGANFGYEFVPPPGSNGGNTTMVGWTLGAGSEYAFTEQVAVRLEYRYSDYGSGSANLVGPDLTSVGRFDLKTHNALMGISVRF